MQRLEPRSVNSGKRGRNLLEFKTRPARVGVAVDDADEVRAIGIAEFADTFTATVSPGRAENRST